MNEYLEATASIATPETDEKLSQETRAAGRLARTQGYPRRANPWTGGLCEIWWNEGYDGHLGSVVMQ